MRDLRAELSSFPEAWRPEPGDVLIGEVVELDQRSGFTGAPYPLVVLRTEAGDDVAVHGFHAVLRDELGKLEPKIGETLGVAYHGRSEPRGAGDSGYERYRVRVVRDDVDEPDWQAIREHAGLEHEAERGAGGRS